MITYLTERPDWVSFYTGFNSSFFVEKAGYFDERPQIHTSITQLVVLFLLPILASNSLWFLLMVPFVFFGWGRLYINLPIKTGIQDCTSAAWGFNYHDNTIWIYVGGAGNFEGGRKWKTINMPWQLTWVRTSTLMKDGYDWFHETKNNRITWQEDDTILGSYKWIDKNKWKETHDFTDYYDGSSLTATISVEEREWRPLWFMWTSLFAKKRKSIDVKFSQEVGERKGSWKGGTLGCSYELRDGETPYECLKRMEKERNF